MISDWNSKTFENLNPKKEIIKYPYFEKDINQELYEIKIMIIYIPIKENSQRVPEKNFREFNGNVFRTYD